MTNRSPSYRHNRKYMVRASRLHGQSWRWSVINYYHESICTGVCIGTRDKALGQARQAKTMLLENEFKGSNRHH